MHCGPGGPWIENCQSNPTQTLFVEGVLMTNQNDPSSSQQPNLPLMLLTWYPNSLFIIESFREQEFKIKLPTKYDGNSHSQFQPFNPTSSDSNSTPPLYLAVFSLSSKQKIMKLHSRSELPMMTLPHSMIKTHLLPHQKTIQAFLWEKEIPNEQSACNLWATLPPGSTFKDRHIIKNKVVSSF
ncbi:hypothetical protein O181_001241 [Austropuccinia psidii MF-1]|uniref:Uncharacterized protein n=1 Tax=Austropuccinia psidii MF-1 TaxID=1389203 RepID=A0A9Q3BAL7_9BASI|nr:hypothetical protein [Austropuccinia psidii MF-1]